MLSSKMRHCMLSFKRVTVQLPKAYSSCPMNCSNLANSPSADVVSSYLDMRRYIKLLKGQSGKIQIPLKVQMDESELCAALRNVWTPTCWTGSFIGTSTSQVVASHMAYNRWLKSSTARADRKKLVESKRQILDRSKSIAQSFNLEEFSANVVLSRTVYQCTDLPGLRIDETDYHPDSDDRIGSLVVILPHHGKLLGGELEVTYEGHTKTIVGEGNWVAFTNSCDIKVNPVRGGDHCLLFYDVYKEGAILPDFTVPDVTDSDSDTDYDSDSGCGRNNRTPTLRSVFASRLEKPTNTETMKKKWTPWHEAYKRSSVKLLGAEGPAIVRKLVLAGVEDELSRRKDIVIALDSRYPEGMVDTTLFKAGDRALYELLSEQYDVQVVTATVNRSYPSATGALYSEQILRQALDSPGATGGHCRSKLILPFKLREEHVLCDDYNEVYLVSCLRVSKKI